MVYMLPERSYGPDIMNISVRGSLNNTVDYFDRLKIFISKYANNIIKVEQTEYTMYEYLTFIQFKPIKLDYGDI